MVRFLLLKNQGFPITRNEGYCLLQECTKEKDLKLVKQVQLLLTQSGLHSISILADHLIRLFSYHNQLSEANQAFDNILAPTTYSWSAILVASAKASRDGSSLELFFSMQLTGIQRDNYVYVAAIQACTLVLAVRFFHEQIINRGLPLDVVIGNALIDRYAKCGSLKEAYDIFIKLPNRDVISWGAMVGAFDQHGEGLLALAFFEKMQQEGLKPTAVTFLAILKACAAVGALEHGRLFHYQILNAAFKVNGSVGNILVDMYAKCGSMNEAYEVFDKLHVRDDVSWASLVAGYAQNGEECLALESFLKMHVEGIVPTELTFLGALKACVGAGFIEQARLIHSEIFSLGYQLDAVICSVLIDTYGKCGSLDEAHQTFFRSSYQNLVAWNLMLAAYIHNGDSHLAVECFQAMEQESMCPDKVTFLSVLKACVNLGSVEHGRLVHCKITDRNLQSDVNIGNTLIHMYAKCQSVEESFVIFYKMSGRSVISWAAMIAAHCEHGEACLALECFRQMQQEGIKPTHVIFVSILKACSAMAVIEQGKFIHSNIVKSGVQSDVMVESSLVDMYAKCGCLEESNKIFQRAQMRNKVLWGAIISGYAQHGKGSVALRCFEDMQLEGIEPDEVTYSSILNACASIGAVQQGILIHKHIIEDKIDFNIVIGSTLVDMYAKFGRLEEACKVFDKFFVRDLGLWGAMISGYVQHGKCSLAVDSFLKMQQEGIVPDDALFGSILIACSRGGLLDEGRWYFMSMRKSYGIIPNVLHWTCLVDLLGRAGCLKEAVYLLQTTIQLNIIGWKSVLGACRMHGNVELGRHCCDEIAQAIMSNMHLPILESNVQKNI